MIIAIASQKGGVGKTSIAISLAAGLARKRKKTASGTEDQNSQFVSRAFGHSVVQHRYRGGEEKRKVIL